MDLLLSSATSLSMQDLMGVLMHYARLAPGVVRMLIVCAGEQLLET